MESWGFHRPALSRARQHRCARCLLKDPPDGAQISARGKPDFWSGRVAAWGAQPRGGKGKDAASRRVENE